MDTGNSVLSQEEVPIEGTAHGLHVEEITTSPGRWLRSTRVKAWTRLAKASSESSFYFFFVSPSSISGSLSCFFCSACCAL